MTKTPAGHNVSVVSDIILNCDIHSPQGTNNRKRTINELSGLVTTCIVYVRVCVFNHERESLSPL